MPETGRKELSRLRALLIEPGNVYLTHAEERIWLTDKYVVLDVTGFSVVQALEDGWYRIIASGANAGLRPPDKKTTQENESATWHLNIVNWLKEVRGRHYWPVIPTEISFTESKAKAFLLMTDTARHEAHRRIPVAMHEDVWQGFKQAWPGAKLSHPGYADPFRISIPGNEDLAYVYGVAIPERLHKVVIAIVEAYESESKG